ncbi:mandelate racemase/muconate lactonizing enzyme family protein [Pseudarthrobacter cellobiosi]|uniref:mandelate racemase/muconate lactonizing enzyme family protein n=1 Tax=Pseudarthrobacter cellobiosi TaxID=2953654 RepID=UPI00208EE793|nr:mandelate racemase/muconate lactonizing enzyme family protein [Pseudarthrobacter sp. HLT1-5]MCO4253735.1 mandelate racemase/muconate lactonizing enzyme family protein [Pseudarthrobacter sp. HLT1-5]
MKITEIKATPVNIPLEPGYLWSVGINRGFAKTIIEVFTDEGIVGLGEAPSHEHARLIDDVIAPRLLGADPYDLAACERMCLPEWQSARNLNDDSLTRAFGGLEIALWDIKAKALGVPLVQLLGGAVHDSVEFSEYFTYLEPSSGGRGVGSVEDVVEYCLRQREENGSTIFEGKVGFLDTATDIRMITALREALGDEATIRLDANYGWSLSTARQVLRELEPLNIANIEDPVIGFDSMARLRKHTSIPFSTHELDLSHAVAFGAPDAFVANIAVLGGIGGTLRFAHACDIMGRDFWFYSGDSGIMTTAYIHMTAALPSVRLPHQSLMRWQTMDVIEGGPLRPKNNVLPVPEGPGLGINIDPDRLAECHQHYLTNGPLASMSRQADGKYHRLPRY